jgi:hypothetical protein
MVEQARTHLEQLNEDAARTNDYVHLFNSEDRFPGVFRCRNELASAEQALEDLLPSLARRLGVHKLKYTSIQNQVFLSICHPRPVYSFSMDDSNVFVLPVEPVIWSVIFG